MELPLEILVHNELLGVRGGKGTLLQVASEGYYEVNLAFGGNRHRVLLPIQSTVIISQSPEAEPAETLEIER